MFDLKTKILVVDDAYVIKTLLIEQLTSIGFSNFLEASDGEEAWDVLNAEPDIGLVISDVYMPGASGLDLLKKLRADRRFETVPFILLTGEDDPDFVIDAILAGANGYLFKPVRAGSLWRQLENASKTP